MNRTALLIATKLAIAAPAHPGGMMPLFSSHPSCEERIAALQRG
ncbi:hypothetical protein [Massilia consociata]|uniref:Uncharacterized protein n=1 Tax=Massilia consociata TaxID=760117 RepID=A0ABV6FEP9_9BURK